MNYTFTNRKEETQNLVFDGIYSVTPSPITTNVMYYDNLFTSISTGRVCFDKMRLAKVNVKNLVVVGDGVNAINDEVMVSPIVYFAKM